MDRIKEKLAKTNLGGRGDYWKPKQGRNVIRILPGVGDMGDFFWQSVGKHYIPETQRSYVCPIFTIGDEDEDAACPICEFVDELYKAGDKDSKELAGKLRVRKQFWMNIIDRENEDKGPQIYTPGVTIFKMVASYYTDPDYGEIDDVEEGLDITIKRAGTGLDTEYELLPKRKSSPLHKDYKLIDEWLDSAIDLSVVELTEDPAEDKEMMGDDAVVSIMPYERIKKEFEQLDVMPEEESDDPFPEDEDDEDEDDEEDVRAVINKRRSRRSRRRS
jgi:hypothetical protein